MDPGEQADEIILTAECEHRVDQIVADTRFALLNFEAVGEEIKKIECLSWEQTLKPFALHHCATSCKGAAFLLLPKLDNVGFNSFKELTKGSQQWNPK